MGKATGFLEFGRELPKKSTRQSASKTTKSLSLTKSLVRRSISKLHVVWIVACRFVITAARLATSFPSLTMQCIATVGKRLGIF